MHDAAIIGAGPVGCYLGYLLSKRGIGNSIVEEHNEVGRPEQCTGLISRNIEGFVPGSWLRKAVQNRVRGAIISCGKASFEVSGSGPMAYVLDRTAFDKAIAEKAKERGSDLVLGHRYVNHKQAGKELRIGLKMGSKTEYLRASALVGADGPNSSVARNSGLYNGRRFWTGTQAIIRSKKGGFDTGNVYVYLDRRYSDGFFAWLVPINEERAKAGLASFSQPAGHMKRLLRDKLWGCRIESRSGGIIPVYKKAQVQKDNVFLVGDAAMQVKATSGGGVVNGFMAAKELAGVIAEGGSYESRIRHVRRNLRLHLLIRRKLNRMSDERKESLLRDMDCGAVRKVLRERGDMDFPKRFVFKLLMARPRLLRHVL